MAITTIQASLGAPVSQPASTNEIQRAAAAKASQQVQKPESVQPPAKTATAAPKVESANNQPAPQPQPVVNTSGQITGTTINTTA
jgi:hypothetical protein